MRGLKAKIAGSLGVLALVGAVTAPGAGAAMMQYQPTNLLTAGHPYFPQGMFYDRTAKALYVAGFNGGETGGGTPEMIHRYDSAGVETGFGKGDFMAVAQGSNSSFGLTASNQIRVFNAKGEQTSAFDAGPGAGAFGQTIGTDAAGNVYVAAPAGVANERQSVTLPNGATGTFTLTFEGQTTASIAATADGETVRTELEELSSVGAGNVSVGKSGTTYQVTFEGAFAGTDVPSLSADSSGLSNGAIAISTINPGSNYPTSGVREFGPSGTLKQVIDCSSCPAPSGFATPSGVSFDDAGNMYVADSASSQVVKFSPSGGNPTDYTSVPPVAFDTGATSALAVNAANGDFFVEGDDGSGYHVKGYHSDGTQFADFGAGVMQNIQTTFGLPSGQLAVDPTSGDVFAGDLTETFETRIWEFAPLFPPVAAVEPASEISQAAATLNGEADPSGNLVTDCHFEYGTDTSYGATAECAEYPGFGNGPVPVSTELSGLAPNTTYHYKLVITNEAGTEESADEEFTTLVEKAAAATGAASGISQTAATISGSVNPRGNPVTACRFEYGPTSAYGQQIACPTNPGAGGADVSESVALSGLAPNTTFHYRIVAVSAGGTATGADASFTTLPKAPAVSTGAASGISATEAKLAGSVNPEGSAATYRFEYGPTTSYGHSSSAGTLSGSAAKPVSTGVAGLTPATSYHYRLVATGPGGTSRGEDKTFATAPRPVGHVAIPATAPIKAGKAQVALECKGVDIATCEGTLTLRARVKQGIRFILTPIGSAKFKVQGGKTEVVGVLINGNGRKALSQAGGKPLSAVVSAGGANRQIRLMPGSGHKRPGG